MQCLLKDISKNNKKKMMYHHRKLTRMHTAIADSIHESSHTEQTNQNRKEYISSGKVEDKLSKIFPSAVAALICCFNRIRRI